MFKVIYKRKDGDPIPWQEVLQGIYEDDPRVRAHGIKNVKRLTITMIPCDEHGSPHYAVDDTGRTIPSIPGSLAYQSCADQYDKIFERARAAQQKTKAAPKTLPFTPI